MNGKQFYRILDLIKKNPDNTEIIIQWNDFITYDKHVRNLRDQLAKLEAAQKSNSQSAIDDVERLRDEIDFLKLQFEIDYLPFLDGLATKYYSGKYAEIIDNPAPQDELTKIEGQSYRGFILDIKHLQKEYAYTIEYLQKLKPLLNGENKPQPNAEAVSPKKMGRPKKRTATLVLNTSEVEKAERGFLGVTFKSGSTINRKAIVVAAFVELLFRKGYLTKEKPSTTLDRELCISFANNRYKLENDKTIDYAFATSKDSLRESRQHALLKHFGSKK